MFWKVKNKIKRGFHSSIRTIFGPDIIHRSKFAAWLNSLSLKIFEIISPARRRQAKFINENPAAPWFAQNAIPFIESLLNLDQTVFEWGSGRSTIWFAKRTKHVTSVEARESWFNDVKKIINEQGLSEKVDLRLAKISSEHNYDSKEVENYASQIDRFSNHHFDIVIVDGHVRVECLAHAVKKVKPGGILILDNSELPEYDSFFNQMKIVEVKRFSNGVQETSVFFCPEEGFSDFK
jgi:hypothetical protein